MRTLAGVLACIAAAGLGACGGEAAAPTPRTADGLRPAPENVLRRCDEVTLEVRLPVRCPARLPGRGRWHVEHRNLGSAPREYVMDLAGRGRGPFHLLLGGRARPWDLRPSGGRWPREAVAGGALRLIGARASRRVPPPPVRPRVVRSAEVAGRPALLLRVAAYPTGGVHGDHLAVVWNQDGRGWGASLHVAPRDRGQERAWLLATAEAMATTAPRRRGAAAGQAVTVSPTRGGPQTAFLIRAPAARGGVFHVRVSGAGGPGCESRRVREVTLEVREQVAVGRVMPDPRFCAGRYAGTVVRRSGRDVARIGEVRFSVR